MFCREWFARLSSSANFSHPAGKCHCSEIGSNANHEHKKGVSSPRLVLSSLITLVSPCFQSVFREIVTPPPLIGWVRSAQITSLSLTSHSSSCAFLRFVSHVAKAQRTSGRQGCCSILPYSVGFARLLPVAFSVNVCQDAYSGRECFISSLHGLRKRSERMSVKNGLTCHSVPRTDAVISAPVSSLTGSCWSLSRTFSTTACSAD